jgi:hypothetical protein
VTSRRTERGRLLRCAGNDRLPVVSRNDRPSAITGRFDCSRTVPKRRVLTTVQQAAWERLRAAAREGWDLGSGPLDRDALHER